MAVILTIGRVGLEIELDHPASWSEVRTLDGGWQVNFKGFLRSTSAADAFALRSEILEQQGQLVACTYTNDPHFDAFYVLTDVRVESIPASYIRNFYQFEVILLRIGSDSRTELQSLLTGAGITNGHSVTGSLWHATPPTALAYNAGSTTPTEHSRPSADGTLGVYIDIDPDQDPTWSIAPINYYKGAVKVYVEGKLRAGLDVASSPANWELTNGIVRLRPQAFGSVSNGRLDLNFHNGTSWGTDITFKIVWANTTDIPAWHYISILRNTAEMSTLRLVRDAATAPPSAHRHVLDMTLRRGAPFVAFYYTYTGDPAQHAVARDVADTSTGLTGHLVDDGTIGGHRWVMGSPAGYGANGATGKINADPAARTFPFFIGAAIDDAANGSGDGPADVRDQYFGWCSETVRAVRR